MPRIKEVTRYRPDSYTLTTRVFLTENVTVTKFAVQSRGGVTFPIRDCYANLMAGDVLVISYHLNLKISQSVWN